MSGNIEFVIGSESHSSRWGKYFVKGLEHWQCKESGQSEKHSSYAEYQCNEIPDGMVFTIFEQSGDKRGTNVFKFSICVVEQGAIASNDSEYGSGKIAGNYRVIASADTATKAPRLMDWWIDQKPSNVDPLVFAEHCAQWIDKRGVKNIPPMEDISAVDGSAKLRQSLAELVEKYGKNAIAAALLEFN